MQNFPHTKKMTIVTNFAMSCPKLVETSRPVLKLHSKIGKFEIERSLESWWGSRVGGIFVEALCTMVLSKFSIIDPCFGIEGLNLV